MIFVFASFNLDSRGRTAPGVPESLRVSEATALPHTVLPQETAPVYASPPFIGLSYIGFREALAFKESRGNYFTTNTLGYLGKYQFGIGTLQLMGVYNASQFLMTPELQEKPLPPIWPATNGFCAATSRGLRAGASKASK